MDERRLELKVGALIAAGLVGLVALAWLMGELSLTRGASLLWALAIHPVVWRDHPGQLFLEFVKFLRLG